MKGCGEGGRRLGVARLPRATPSWCSPASLVLLSDQKNRQRQNPVQAEQEPPTLRQASPQQVSPPALQHACPGS